jgi:hypothetical protein
MLTKISLPVPSTTIDDRVSRTEYGVAMFPKKNNSDPEQGPAVAVLAVKLFGTRPVMVVYF